MDFLPATRSKSLLKDNAFFNNIYERTINLDINTWNNLKTTNYQLNENQIDPTLRLSILWFLFMSLFDMIYIGFLLPIILAFSSLEIISEWSIIELICSVVLILNVVFGLSIGYIVRVNYELIVCRDVRISTKVYIRYGTFVIDMLSLLPSILFIVFEILSYFVSSYKYEGKITLFLLLVRFVRLFRITRMLRNGALSHTIITSINIPLTLRNSKILIAFTLGYIATSLANILACIWFGAARIQGYENTWISNAGLSHYPNFENYVAALYFVVQTLTTVGYGDIPPTNTVERSIDIVFMLIGVILFLSVIGMLTHVFLPFNHVNDTNNLMKQMEGLDKIGTLKTIDRSIKRQIKEHYQDFILHEKELTSTWHQFMEDLPGSKRSMLVKCLVKDAVENIEELRHLTANQKAILYANAHYVPFTWMQQELCFAGELFKDYLLLVDGDVKLDDESIMVAPALIGNELMRDNFIKHTIIARKNCLVFKIGKTILDSLLISV
jgi:hypothetical protein